jgi:hypothetical protein
MYYSKTEIATPSALQKARNDRGVKIATPERQGRSGSQ